MVRLLLLGLALALMMLGGCRTARSQETPVVGAKPTLEVSVPATRTSPSKPEISPVQTQPGTSKPQAPPKNDERAPLMPTPAPGVPPSSRPGDRFGVTLAATELDPRTPRALELAGQAGIGWVRLIFFWSRIEPQRDRFTWQQFDALVAKARGEGLEVLGVLGFGTLWNTTAPPLELRPDKREHYPPADYGAWERYVFEVVSRYKDAVHVWEVWNEQDAQAFWGGSPAEYARLLAVAHQAVKRADPNAQVALGGLALGGSPGRFNPEFLGEILADSAHPAGQFFDIAAFHHYGSLREARRRMSYVRGELERFGLGERPIWITEVGYASDPRHQQEERYNNGPESQAAWLKDRLPIMLEGGAAKLFWYTLYDDPKGGPTFVSHGLLDADLVPRPAYHAFRELIAGRSGG